MHLITERICVSYDPHLKVGIFLSWR